MCRSIQRFNISIPENSWAFNCRPCPVNGEFESCLAGVGNLNRKCQVFPVRIQGVLIFKKVKSSLSRGRSFVVAFFLFSKKMTVNSSISDRTIEQNFGTEGWEFQQTNLQK